MSIKALPEALKENKKLSWSVEAYNDASTDEAKQKALQAISTELKNIEVEKLEWDAKWEVEAFVKSVDGQLSSLKKSIEKEQQKDAKNEEKAKKKEVKKAAKETPAATPPPTDTPPSQQPQTSWTDEGVPPPSFSYPFTWDFGESIGRMISSILQPIKKWTELVEKWLKPLYENKLTNNISKWATALGNLLTPKPNEWVSKVINWIFSLWKPHKYVEFFKKLSGKKE